METWQVAGLGFNSRKRWKNEEGRKASEQDEHNHGESQASRCPPVQGVSGEAPTTSPRGNHLGEIQG